jgi:hypothetical protein
MQTPKKKIKELMNRYFLILFAFTSIIHASSRITVQTNFHTHPLGIESCRFITDDKMLISYYNMGHFVLYRFDDIRKAYTEQQLRLLNNHFEMIPIGSCHTLSKTQHDNVKQALSNWEQQNPEKVVQIQTWVQQHMKMKILE